MKHFTLLSLSLFSAAVDGMHLPCFKKFIRRGSTIEYKCLVIATFVSTYMITSPISVSAVDGSSPKMEYFNSEIAMKSTSPRAYDESNIKNAKEKLKSLSPKWTTTVTKVELAISKGEKAEIQSILGIVMGSLKTDMRQLSKFAVQGDIVSRSDGPNWMNANFDYNTGQFALKEIPQKAEDFISLVNDYYFYSVKEGKDKSLSAFAHTDKAFKEWYSIVSTAIESLN